MGEKDEKGGPSFDRLNTADLTEALGFNAEPSLDLVTDAQAVDPLREFLRERSEAMNLDLKDPQVQKLLEIEYWDAQLEQWIVKQNFSAAKLPVEHYLKLAPDHPKAIAKTALVRYRTALDLSARTAAYLWLIEREKVHPSSLEIELTLAELAHDRQETQVVNAALTKAKELAPVDARYLELRERLKKPRAPSEVSHPIQAHPVEVEPIAEKRPARRPFVVAFVLVFIAWSAAMSFYFLRASSAEENEAPVGFACKRTSVSDGKRVCVVDSGTLKKLSPKERGLLLMHTRHAAQSEGLKDVIVKEE